MTAPTDLADDGASTPTLVEPTDEVIVGRSPNQIAFERLRKDKVAVFCALVGGIMILSAICAPLISKAMGIHWDIGHPDSVDGLTATDVYGTPKPEFGPPYGDFTMDHPLGIAPKVGTDNLSYLLFGMRNSMFIALLATTVSVIVGLAVGLSAGFSRGWLDRVLSFTIDLFLSFPFILFTLALAPILVSQFADDTESLNRWQLWSLIIVLSIFGWMGLARLVRGQVISLREREFVLAAQVLGASTWRILVKELVPNLVATLVVVVSLAIPGFIAAEVGLSFLGIGLSGSPSMGQVIRAAGNYYDTYPLYLWAPVATLTVLVLVLNLLGDSIRDAFDPKTRR